MIEEDTPLIKVQRRFRAALLENANLRRELVTTHAAGHRKGMEEAAKITDAWANSVSCNSHDTNPCCHVRTGAAIAEAIRRRIDSL